MATLRAPETIGSKTLPKVWSWALIAQETASLKSSFAKKMGPNPLTAKSCNTAKGKKCLHRNAWREVNDSHCRVFNSKQEANLLRVYKINLTWANIYIFESGTFSKPSSSYNRCNEITGYDEKMRVYWISYDMCDTDIYWYSRVYNLIENGVLFNCKGLVHKLTDK